MKLPMKVYSLAKAGDKAAMAFKQQYGEMPGEYQNGMWESFKQQFENNETLSDDDITAALGEQQPAMTPEEKKATKAIEGYGEKYGNDHYEEDLAWWDKDSPDQTEKDLAKFEKESDQSSSARPNETKLFSKLDEYAMDEDYKEQALNAIQWNGNWSVADRVRKDELLGSSDEYDYDSKSDEEISDDYYAAVEDGIIDGKDAFETMIGDLSDDSVGEFMHEYGLDDEDDDDYESDLGPTIFETMREEGIDLESPEEVAEYLGATAGYDREDQIEIMSQLFGKEQADSFFYDNDENDLDGMENEKTNPERQEAMSKIKTVLDRINSSDADSSDGYMTEDESAMIKDLATKYKITADELSELNAGGHALGEKTGEYSVDYYAYKEPEQQTDRFKVKSTESESSKKVKNFLNGLSEAELFFVKELLKGNK